MLHWLMPAASTLAHTPTPAHKQAAQSRTAAMQAESDLKKDRV